MSVSGGKVIYADIKAAYEIHVRIENGLRGYERKSSKSA